MSGAGESPTTMFLDLAIGSLFEVTSGRSWSPAETLAEVEARCARNRSLGVGRGDRVFLHFGNRLEFFAELLAVWRVGGCAVPLDSRLTAFEAETIASAARPRLAVIDDATDPAIAERLGRLGVAVVDTTDPARGLRSAAGASESARPSPARLDDDALILFTSGSTGNPKGVLHTHRSLRARWISLRQSLGLAPFRKTLCLLPTHFGHGLICNCLFPWLSGQDLFITPPFKADLVMRLGNLVDDNAITFVSSVPSMWRVALKLGQPPKLGTLERVHCGSAPLAAAMWSDIQRWSGTRAVANAYGITETGSWVAGVSGVVEQPEDGLIGDPWGAVVRVLASREPEAIGEPAAICPPGESGFVWLHTPALMKGYFEREDLTDQVVSNGWFMTGDVGALDERGRLYLRGRERDEINKGGAKIYPADIDAAVESFSGTSDVCAFALDDPMYGQNVGLAVVLSDRSDTTIRALHAWMKERLAEPKMPVKWFLLDEIPRTSRGKVNRELVKDACAAATAVDLARILRGGPLAEGKP